MSSLRLRNRRRLAAIVCLIPVSLGLLVFALPGANAEPNQAAAGDDQWHVLPIPDSWKKVPGGNLAPVGGYAWYRCFVMVPESWQEREIELFVEPIDDARTAYVNGVQVGASGTFPPRYRSGLGEAGRYKVPADAIRFGEYNLIAVRTYYNDGRNNFSVAAPVLLAEGEAIRMEGKWQYRPGDDLAWASPEGLAAPSALNPEAGVFGTVDHVDDIDSYVRRRQGDHDKYPPAEALKRFKLPEDLALEQPLAEPHIGQPLFMNFDERGRLWVMQYLQYPNPAGLTAISRDQHLRTVYDKVPPAPPNHFRGADKITIHEDTDGDGRYDRHKTFVEGLSLATSFARGRGGLWVLNPPYLLFYPDGDGDDVPDADPEVHLEGFGIEDSHSVVNSLRWGPDGWLYAGQGSTVTGNVGRPGEKEVVRSMGQLIWRYHPETRRYEIFAEGGGNTFGVEIDAKGRVFSGHNGGDTRGFHYVQGGYLQKGFGKHGSLSNPYAFGYFAQMQHHSVRRFTHNFIIYEADTLPEPYRGKLFGIEPLQGQVVESEITTDRSSFQTRDIQRPITTDDQWFRPVDIKVGPDGGVYIADMYEQRIDHSSHYAGRIDKESGRIYRLTAKNAPRPEPFDYSKLSGPELVELLRHPNKWHRQTALRLIGDRRDASLVPLLKDLLDDQTGQLALEALWALHLNGGLDKSTALDLLDHDDPYVRLWTVRLLGDEREVSPELAVKLAELARKEPHVEVRSQLASSARRLSAEHSLPIARNLLVHDADAADIHLPLLVWWAIEAKADTHRDAVLALFSDKSVWQLPLVRQHIIERLMRRYAQAGTRKDLLTCARLLELAPGQEEARLLMAGFESAYKGRSLATLPDELIVAITKTGGGSPALRLRQGDAEATKQALRFVGDEKADAQQRLGYVQIFGEVRLLEAVPVLLQLVKQSSREDLRSAALTALQGYDRPEIGAEIASVHDSLPEDVRSVAQTLLASRKTWALEFASAIDAGQIDRTRVPDAIVRKLLLHNDAQLAAIVQKHWGELQGTTTESMRAEIERLSHVIGEAAGNPYEGRKLFTQNCGKCHTLFEQGGQIGPDLTAYKRDDLNRMLLNVVNPSAEIREGFENYLIVTADGRVVNGFLADQDNRVVVLRGVDGQNLIIPRDDIDDMRAIPQSVMPEGNLKDLTDQQIRDLFAYLRSTQPLP